MSDTKTALAEAIRSRRSTRAYNGTPPNREVLAEIIEAGRYAPSGSNNQYAHFLVISGDRLLTELR
jgi:nitroreductase